MAKRRQGLAKAARLVEAFGGGPFVPIAPGPITEIEVAGFSGWADEPGGITLRCRVGPERRVVEVETERGHDLASLNDMQLALRVLLGQHGQLRFPVVIEQRTLRIRAERRVRVFKGCAIGERSATRARFGETDVIVSCPDGLPGDGFALGRLEGPALKNLVRQARKRFEEPRPGAKRRRSAG